MKEWLTVYLRSLYSVTKQIKVSGLITALLAEAEFSRLSQPLGIRPLILSAHPGDEVMALGGTMAWYAKAKQAMTVLTFTAGRHGTNTGRLSRSLGPRRRKEQLAGFKVIGGEIQPYFWDLDEKFSVTEEMIFRLIEFIDELNPDIIYVPSLLDNHPDSESINQLVTQVLKRLPTVRTKRLGIAQYELWTPLVPNKIFSINDFEELKERAIQCHESQLLCRNYLEAMVGLNQYRAAILGAGNYAEAFYICTAKQYTKFLSQLRTPVVHMIDH